MNRHASINRIYRLVWSQVRSTWVPVAETSRGRGKSSVSKSIPGRNTLAAAISLVVAPFAHAAAAAPPCVAPTCGTTSVSTTTHPLGGKVVSGSATITQSGNVTDVRQSSADVSIDWLTFNIGAQASVDFLQPSASAVAVNRILGNSGSQILGHLDANGQVYLINPNGVLFGQGAQVNVGGLVASTLDVSDSSLSSNTRNFGGSGTGNIVNQGTITAAHGGYVALLGNRVSNQGVITAQLGTVALGAGSAVTLNFSGDRLVHLEVDQSTLNNLAANQQLIEADGGMVIMSAGAQRSLLASVVNNSGVIEARTVENHNGTIELLGGMTAGTANVAGTLDASAPDGGHGGFIETDAAHVEVANGSRVTTAAASGLIGSWLLDPQDFTIASSGGDITGATLSSELRTTSVTLLSSSGATTGSGNINVDDTVSWSANTLTLTAANNVNVNAVMTATGSASLALNPATANGVDAAVPGGTVVMGLNSSGFTGMVNINSTGALSINGTAYTVINSLGASGSTTGTDLQGINGKLSGHYALGSDINAGATATWNSGDGFTPLGRSNTTPFTGSFEGLGHTITGLTINLASTDNIGLFGNVGSTGIVRNVGLVGGSVGGLNTDSAGELIGANYGGMVSNAYATGSVSGYLDVGGLVGYNFSGTINSGYATGTVSGEYSVGGLVGGNGGTVINSYATGSVVGGGGGASVGGLVGANTAMVSNSYATGNVSAGNGSEFVGGLVGSVNIATVTSSYATGTVNGSSEVGGLVGAASGGTISKSYATGAVSGFDNLGGLLGFNKGGTLDNSYATGSVATISSGTGSVGGLIGANYGTVSECYATGSVTGAGNLFGGLVGINVGTITNSYSTGNVSGGSSVGGLVGYNSNGGTVVNSYWNLTTSGQPSSSGGIGLTTPQMQTTANFAGFAFTTVPGASGNDWVIVDVDGTLNNVGGAVGATFPMLASEYSTTINNAHQLQLMAMNAGASYTLGQNIAASGTGSGNDVWSSIGFAPIGNSTAPFSGTFDGLGHTISNLYFNGAVRGGTLLTGDAGLFADASPGAVIRNVGLIGGSVYGFSGSIGALVGTNYGTVSNSYATANVGSLFGTSGGLVGENSGTISNSYASGNVVSDFGAAGGLTGSNSGTVSNSHATGGVGAEYATGGLVGANSGTIRASYATGNVGASEHSTPGGLVGANYGTGTITASYATGNVIGIFGAGGLVGSNGGTISTSYATGSVSSNFEAGGLANENSGTIIASYATGSVKGYSDIGGLVGGNYGTIVNSFAVGKVVASGNYGSIGGLIGNNSGGTVSNSYATGVVSGSNYVGGLVGTNYGGKISNSYATGMVIGSQVGSNGIGGLVGFNTNGGTVSNSYSAGHVNGESNVGGLIGIGASGIAESFWDTTTSGQLASAGGLGMTTANMQNQANFTSATGANGNVNPNWDFTNNWVMYSGFTYPLLRSFMTPLTVTANSGSVTYNGAAYNGANGVTYSVTPNGNLFGTLTFNSASGPAVNVGSYVITPGGLYSNQQGYIISYGSGNLTINQLASVAWAGGTTGNWSTASNWAGGAIPDYSNVAAVTIPKGDTVTYDTGMAALGTTKLTTLTDSGNLVMAAGTLDTTGNLSTGGFTQSGGVLDVGGSLTVLSTGGVVTLGNITAGTLNVTSQAGAIKQLASTALDVTGTSDLTADNGVSGTGDKKYNITLDNAGNKFVGAVASDAMNIGVVDSLAGLILGNTTATSTLTDTSQGGALTQVAGSAVTVTGTSILQAFNGATKYAVTLAQAGDSFGGAVTAEGSGITLTDKTALTAILDSSGPASLTAAGAMNVSGTVGTKLTTTTTGTNHATTFGKTTVGKSLVVTSTGAVTETSSNILTVAGKGTTTVSNPNVKVNGVKGAKIPAP